MMGIDDAAVALGSVVVQAAIKLWLGDRSLAADIASSATEALSSRATDLLRKRQTARLMERMTDVVAVKLRPYLGVEYSNLPENERVAAIHAVRDTFGRAALTDEDLFAHDLNATYLDKYLRRAVPELPRQALLSEAASSLYDVVLRECCEYTVQIITTLPTFQAGILTEILRRESEIANLLIEVLDRLPERERGRGTTEFEVDYRRQVKNRLDSMELFGATLSTASRRYPLSVAYISLSVSDADTGGASNRAKIFDDLSFGSQEEKSTIKGASNPEADALGIPVESALTRANRLFVRGDAGRGKTSLLKWIAVRSAMQDFPEQLAFLNDTTPFFIPLRNYVDSEPPPPETFLANLGRHIADEMPHGWVHKHLRSGKAIVLIDGVDELPEAQRDTVREWVRDLVTTFPESRYVVTSRSGAAGPDWLREENFFSLELQPMTAADIRLFIHQWHNAIRSQVSDSDEVETINHYERWLVEKLNMQRHLRILAETPLLCALLCALHRDRRAHLPHNRIELYEVALEMLLERRDAEQRVPSEIPLSRTHKTLLLQDVAYWLVRNGRSQADKDWVLERLASKIPVMSIPWSPHQVYRNLLERSGLLREPVADQIDFVHRSFQEYLAALESVAQNDIGLLVKNANLDQWREVVIMASGCAYPGQREELLNGLIHRGSSDPQHANQMYLLAVACLETSPELSLRTRQEIRRRVADLLPPPNISTAKSLALAGEFVVDLLAQSHPHNARETASTVRAAAEIGGDPGLAIIKNYRRDRRSTVQTELMRAWTRFDLHEYAEEILRHNPTLRENVTVSDPSQMASLSHLQDLTNLKINFLGELDLSYVGALTRLSFIWLQAQGQEVQNFAAIENLKALNWADFGAVPLPGLEPLHELTNLRSLLIYGCGINDISPLSSLSELRVLNLSNNPISDITPTRNMVKMSDLWFSHTQVSDIDPLEHMAELTRLDFESTKVEDVSVLASLGELRNIKMSRTSVRDISALGSTSKLTHLNCNGLSGISDISSLAGHTAMEELNLAGTTIQDISALANMSQLQSLSLTGSSVADANPLSGLRRVTRLYLDSTNIGSIDALANLAQLQTLNISNTQVSDISPLGKLRSLRVLFLTGTPVRDLTPLARIPLMRVAMSRSAISEAKVPNGLKVTWD